MAIGHVLADAVTSRKGQHAFGARNRVGADERALAHAQDTGTQNLARESDARNQDREIGRKKLA